MKNKGFSVVELALVIVIMGILLSLGTVQVLRSQTVARDKSRADDVRAIGITLQDVYDNGSVDGTAGIVSSGDAAVTDAVVMGYPSTKLITTSSGAQAATIFQNIRLDALKSPFMMSNATTPAFSLVAASSNSDLNNTTKTAGGITLGQSNDVYVYQPLDSLGSLCLFATGNVTTGTGTSATTGKAASATQVIIAPRLVDNCVKYNIYYYSEGQESIIKVKSQKSSSDGLY